MDAYIESWRLVSRLSPFIAKFQTLAAFVRCRQKKDEKKSEAAVVVEAMQQELFARAQREKMPPSALPSLINSASAAMRATSLWVCMKMPPGESSSRCLRKVPRFRESWMAGPHGVYRLQYGVPLKVYVDKLLNTALSERHHRESKIRFVSSVLDYIARWLGGALSPRLPEIKWRRGAGRRGTVASAAVPAPVVAQALAALPVSALHRNQQCSRSALRVRVRHADGSEWRLLQVRKLRQHQRLQLTKAASRGPEE